MLAVNVIGTALLQTETEPGGAIEEAGDGNTSTVTYKLHDSPQLSDTMQLNVYTPADKTGEIVCVFGYTPPTPSLHVKLNGMPPPVEFADIVNAFPEHTFTLSTDNSEQMSACPEVTDVVAVAEQVPVVTVTVYTVVPIGGVAIGLAVVGLSNDTAGNHE